MSETLYDRLGGLVGVKSIANDIIDNHLNNPLVSQRFAQAKPEDLKKVVSEFISSGTGGPDIYKGKDMIATHRGMNISGSEFIAAMDDIISALESNNVGQREKEEVAFAMLSTRKEVMAQ